MRFLPTCCYLLCLTVSTASASTTTTYTYNPDGALTAITVQRGSDPATTTHLTWDDFEPDPARPATGTVSIGDGNLVSLGSTPGAPAEFGFDVRNRLVSQGVAPGTQTYGYHANSLLSDATLGTGRRQFYQDHGAYPETTNIVETGGEAGDVISAHLGMGRYLSDGTEEALVNPRKDTAGLMDLDDGTFAGAVYEPFGAPQAGFQPATSFNLGEPDLGYAGEYEDPGWGGIYLRARWYDPSLAQFISRDPQPHLNRYGYAGGNPVMNVDPGGMSFMHSLGRDIERAMSGSSVGDHFARFFLAPVLGPAEIAANPKGFWESVKHDRGGIDVFLAVGIATEFASIGLESFGWSETIRTLNVTQRIWGRRLFDLSLGTAQAVTAGAEHGFKHFSLLSASASLELSFGALGWSHYVSGVGYHPYTQKGVDLIDAVNRLAQEDDGGALVFRERDPMYASGSSGVASGSANATGIAVAHASPLGEYLNVGIYHEAVLVVTRDGIYRNELGIDSSGIYGQRFTKDYHSDEIGDMLRNRAGGKARYQLVGRLENFRPRDIMQANPLSLYVKGHPITQDTFVYGSFKNNCHLHASAVIQSLFSAN